VVFVFCRLPLWCVFDSVLSVVVCWCIGFGGYVAFFGFCFIFGGVGFVCLYCCFCVVRGCVVFFCVLLGVWSGFVVRFFGFVLCFFCWVIFCIFFCAFFIFFLCLSCFWFCYVFFFFLFVFFMVCRCVLRFWVV